MHTQPVPPAHNEQPHGTVASPRSGTRLVATKPALTAQQIAPPALAFAAAVFFGWCASLDPGLAFFFSFAILCLLAAAVLTLRIFTQRICPACRAKIAKLATVCASCRTELR